MARSQAEPERGETTRAREQKAKAPVPKEKPAATPEEIAQQAAAPPEETPAAQPQQAPPEGFTVRNPYMLLPPTVNFAPQGKSTAEQNYDVGMLWDVLANSPNSDPIMKTIARRLIGGE